MSTRDKYSGDHTITVNEGSGTLTVDGNISVSGDFDVDNIALTNTVTQRMKFFGVDFNTTDDSDISYPSAAGRIVIGSTSTINAYCSIPNLPHGATITGFEVRASATGASASLDVSLIRSDGGSAGILASVSYANESESTKTDTSIAVPAQVDYSTGFGYLIRIEGQRDAGASIGTFVKYVDIIYTIENFPQDSESAPV